MSSFPAAVPSLVTLCAAADVVVADPTELLSVLPGRVSTTAAVI